MLAILRRHRILLLLFAVLFLVMVGFGIVIPVLPFFIEDLGGGAFEMGIILTVYAIAQFLFAPMWGRISDRVGRKPVLCIGMLGFGITFIWMGLATSILEIVLARFLGGVLAASTFPTTQAYVADVTSPEERSGAMGFIGSAFGVGFLVGPLAGAVLEPFGPAFAFFVAGSCSLATAVISWFVLGEPAGKEQVARPHVSPWEAIRLAVRGDHSLLYWLAFVLTFAMSALFVSVPYLIADRTGGGQYEVGILFGILGAVALVVQGGLLAWATMRWGDRRVLLAGILFSSLGYAAMITSETLPLIIAASIFAGLGMGLTRPVIASVLSKVTTMRQGLTMGIQSSFDSLGRALGPLVGGFIYLYWIGAPFLLSALVSLAALLVTMARLPGIMAAGAETAEVPPAPAGAEHRQQPGPVAGGGNDQPAGDARDPSDP